MNGRKGHFPPVCVDCLEAFDVCMDELIVVIENPKCGNALIVFSICTTSGRSVEALHDFLTPSASSSLSAC